MVTRALTKQEHKALRKHSILLRMLTFEYPLLEFEHGATLSVGFLLSYDVQYFRWALPLYEHLSLRSMSLSVKLMHLCVPPCVSVSTPLGHRDNG